MPDKHCTGVHRPNHALGPLIKPSLWNAARQRPRIQVPLLGVDVRHWPNPPIDETRLQTCPSIHLHWRPSVCRPLWYDLADAITTAAKPFLPEHHVSKDFSYRMERSI